MNQLQATQGISPFKYLHKYSDYSIEPTVFISVNGQKSISIKTDWFLYSLSRNSAYIVKTKQKTKRWQLRGSDRAYANLP